MTQNDLRTALERLIVGDLPSQEASRMAAEAGYRSFADLCEAELPERLPRVRIDRGAVRQRIAHATTGRISLGELRTWAEELATVLDRHELDVSALDRRQLSESLSLVAVAADTRIFRNTDPVLSVLSHVAQSLTRRRAGDLATLYGRLFHDQPVLHLVPRTLDELADGGGGGEGSQGEPGQVCEQPPTYLPQPPSFLDALGLDGLELEEQAWTPDPAQEEEPRPAPSADVRCADVVALSRPFEPGGRLQDYEWVVAFSVATRALVQEDSVPGAGAPAVIERARDLAPNFDFTRFRPEARRDQDGVLELVIDAKTVGRDELVYAAKLFALVHKVGRVYFEGRRLRTIRAAT